MCGISNFSWINVTKTAAVKAISSLYTIVKILKNLGQLFIMTHKNYLLNCTCQCQWTRRRSTWSWTRSCPASSRRTRRRTSSSLRWGKRTVRLTIVKFFFLKCNYTRRRTIFNGEYRRLYTYTPNLILKQWIPSHGLNITNFFFKNSETILNCSPHTWW